MVSVLNAPQVLNNVDRVTKVKKFGKSHIRTTRDLVSCYEWCSIEAHRSTIRIGHTRSHQEFEQASAPAACEVQDPLARAAS
jgi:hypothetical protein